uniref:Uncharacterized protein n=1 Tax=Mustela putorius furo TaxID=9669 RepID=M3Y0Z5_MUSPF
MLRRCQELPPPECTCSRSHPWAWRGLLPGPSPLPLRPSGGRGYCGQHYLELEFQLSLEGGRLGGAPVRGRVSGQGQPAREVRHDLDLEGPPGEPRGPVAQAGLPPRGPLLGPESRPHRLRPAHSRLSSMQGGVGRARGSCALRRARPSQTLQRAFSWHG